MNYPVYLAQRLSLGSDGKKISPAVAVAIIAISISVMVMIASIAIVLGFKKEIREKVVGFNGHISLFKVPVTTDDNNILELSPFLENTLREFHFVKEFYLQAAMPAILKTDTDFKGVYLRGLTGDNATAYIQNNLEAGYLPDYSNEEENKKILISHIASRQLKLSPGDKLNVYFITDDIRVRKLEIAGIFNSHFDQYDDVLIFGSMSLIQNLAGLNERSGTYLVLQTDNFDKIPEYTQLVQEKLTQGVAFGETKDVYRADNVFSQGRSFFSWLSLLDTNVVVIIILMLVVACVTLVSGMLIIILEKKKFIGVMRSLGANTGKIRSIFIFLAIKIAIIGLIIGNFLILWLLFLQDKYHFLHLDADAYYIDFVPVFLPGWIVVALNLGVLILTYLILVLPSNFVAKISPAESMIEIE